MPLSLNKAHYLFVELLCPLPGFRLDHYTYKGLGTRRADQGPGVTPVDPYAIGQVQVLPGIMIHKACNEGLGIFFPELVLD